MGCGQSQPIDAAIPDQILHTRFKEAVVSYVQEKGCVREMTVRHSNSDAMRKARSRSALRLNVTTPRSPLLKGDSGVAADETSNPPKRSVSFLAGFKASDDAMNPALKSAFIQYHTSLLQLPCLKRALGTWRKMLAQLSSPPSPGGLMSSMSVKIAPSAMSMSAATANNGGGGGGGGGGGAAGSGTGSATNVPWSVVRQHCLKILCVDAQQNDFLEELFAAAEEVAGSLKRWGSKASGPVPGLTLLRLVMLHFTVHLHANLGGSGKAAGSPKRSPLPKEIVAALDFMASSLLFFRSAVDGELDHAEVAEALMAAEDLGSKLPAHSITLADMLHNALSAFDTGTVTFKGYLAALLKVADDLPEDSVKQWAQTAQNFTRDRDEVLRLDSPSPTGDNNVRRADSGTPSSAAEEEEDRRNSDDLVLTLPLGARRRSSPPSKPVMIGQQLVLVGHG